MMNEKKERNYRLALPFTYLWIGFVCAISFMEAWIKFRAPGVTLPIGLGIGSLVFSALNKMEWLFALLIALDISLISRYRSRKAFFLFSTALLLLVIQTIWLLPALDARIDLYRKGMEVPESPLHFMYIGAEVLKVASLILLGIHLIKLTEFRTITYKN